MISKNKKENSFLKNLEDKTKNPLLYCSKCREIPYVLLKTPTKVLVKCECFEEFKLVTVENFMEQLQDNSKKEKNIYCENHSSVSSNCLCLDCFKQMCEDCLKEHEEKFDKKHTIVKPYFNIKLEKESEQLDKEINIDELEKQKEKALEHIMKYNKKLHKNIPFISDSDKGKIKKCYKKNLKISQKQLLLFESILLTYEEVKDLNLKNVKKNLLDNSNFNFEKCIFTDEDTYYGKIQKLTDYYKANFILIKKEKLDKKQDAPKLENEREVAKLTHFVNTLLILENGRIACCSDKNSIDILDQNSFEIDLIIEGHEGKITSIAALEDGRLISSSLDNTIKIWKITSNSYLCEGTIPTNEKGEYKITKLLSLNQSYFASCGSDSKIRIWETKMPNDCINVLLGHSKTVKSILKLGDNELVSGGHDLSIIFWDLNKYEEISRVNNVFCSDSNSIVEGNKNKLFVCGVCVITVINTNTYEVIKRIKDYSLGCFRCCLKLKNGGIIAGNDEGVLYFIDKYYNYEIIKEKAHSDYITSLISFDGDKILSSSYDKTIKMWKV